MERWYVAVVDGSRLLDRARMDPEFGEYLAVPSYFRRGRERLITRPEGADFLGEVDAMNRLHPGIETRIYTLDRAFDSLHYLLSEARRHGEFDVMDWGTKAILGGTSLADHLRGTQGHRIRYSPPADVHEIVAGLAVLTPEDLRAVYSPEAMQQQCVYQFWADRADAESWDRMTRYLEGLRAFYALVSSKNEGVLAIVT